MNVISLWEQVYVFHKPIFKFTYEEEIQPVIMQNVCPGKGYFHTLINKNNKYKYFFLAQSVIKKLKEKKKAFIESLQKIKEILP